MTHSILPALAKPFGLLLVCGLLTAPACGKKDEPEPATEEAPIESAEPAEKDAPKAESDTTEPTPDVDAVDEQPRRPPPGDLARPGRRGPRDGEPSDIREMRPRLKPGDRPTPIGDSPEPVAKPEPTNPEANPGTPAEPTPVAEAPARPTPVPTEVTGPTPEAGTVLPFATVAEVIKGKKLAPTGPLPGIAVQPGYSSMLYATADGKSLGVSLQIWQDPARRESDDRYRRMRLQYPKPEDVNAMPPAKAFYSYFSGVQTLTFVDSVKRVVASISCGEGVCTHEQLLKLARMARERL